MNKQEINTEALAKEIKTMSVRSRLYRLLKKELSARGWWKNRPRGNGGKIHNQ